MKDLMFVVDHSGDSILKDYHYKNQFLTLILYLSEFDRIIKFQIETNDISFNNFYLQKNNSIFRTCRIEINKLENSLLVENNFYVPPCNFAKVMIEAKSNLNLAYGKKVKEVNYIFSLVGYGVLISCLIYNFDSINMMEI